MAAWAGRVRDGMTKGAAVIFLLAGLFFTGVYGLPILRSVQARSWRETPCTILSCEVEVGGGRRSSFRIAVSYEYTIDDRRFVSSRYSFLDDAISSYPAKDVERLRPGTPSVCYVNPRDPASAVIERGFTREMLFVLLPLLVIPVAGYGVVHEFRRRPART